MRYLPTLEIGHQIFQLALPDVHAVALAECCLTKSNQDADEGLHDLLLTSPMLLFWLNQKLGEGVNGQGANGQGAIPDSSDSRVNRLLDLMRQKASHLVQDNSKPLSSVVRVETEVFLDPHCFFQVRAEQGLGFAQKIIERLAVLNHGLNDGLLGRVRSSAGDLYLSEFQIDQLISKYEQTDFSQLPDRQLISEQWQLEIPFFRSGFGSLAENYSRLNALESRFEEVLEREKISAIQQLAYGASHEINNPLANISTRAQALLRDEADPKRRQRLQTIDAQAFRAHDMISNLMTFAKPRRPKIERFQLRPIAEKAVAPLVSAATEQGVTIGLDIASSVYLEADADQVQEMIFALVQNSIEAIREGGEVRVQCELPQEGSPIKVEVVDNGPGISAEVRQHLFDPFFSGREAGRGLGFGMSKVWSLMELHQGGVRATEKSGKTCIELWFPANRLTENRIDIEKTA